MLSKQVELFRWAVVAAIVALALAGCSLPIESKDMPGLISAMAENNATACFRTGASGYGGGMAGLPGVAGGGGEANLTFCRSNEPGSEIVVTASELRIKHGSPGMDPKAVARIEELEGMMAEVIEAIRALISRGPVVRVD